ncbi:MAG: lysoplasmalogenase [Propionibacteriaceae bacterium]|jgi:hypothetical protein|nr:lysoplasmalogenase [Propionibacteriaceae bacterium]
MLTIAATIVGIGFVVPNTWLRLGGVSLQTLLFKTICGVLFTLAGASAIIYLPAALVPLGVLVLLGLMFGLLGDIWLALKELVPNAHDNYLWAGFAAFGIGHVFFVAGLLAAWRPGWPSILGAFAAAAVVPLAVLVLENRLRLNFGKFKWIAVGYGFLLCLTPSTALFTAFSGPQIGWQALLMGIGGVCFFASDLVLAAAYFGRSDSSAANHIACYALYYGAQFTIALSLLLA